MNNRCWVLPALSVLLIILAACSPGETSNEPAAGSDGQPSSGREEAPLYTAADLTGEDWRLVTLFGTDILPGSGPALTFDGAVVNGHTGCNTFGAGYEAGDDGKLQIFEIESTAASCLEPEGVMDQESAFIRALQNAAWYEIDEGVLQIENASGDVILILERPGSAVASDLAGGEWILETIRGESLVPGSNITLTFGDGELNGYAGCNSYFGSYQSNSDGAIEVGQLGSTEMACLVPEGLMVQEETYLSALHESKNYEIADGGLALNDSAGQLLLRFRSKPTVDVDPADLVGTGWKLAGPDGMLPFDGSAVTLILEDSSSYRGDAGCRDYEGSYQASGDDIAFPSIRMSEPDCPDLESYLEREAAFTDALGLATNYRLSQNTLEIDTAAGETLFFESLDDQPADVLDGTFWSLTTFVQGDVASSLINGTQIDIEFSEGGLFGSAGCNAYGGSYTISEAELAVQDLSYTEMACLEPQGLMDQESKYLDILSQVKSFRIVGDQLLLSDGAERQLLYVK